jgi:hypothetical protein
LTPYPHLVIIERIKQKGLSTGDAAMKAKDQEVVNQARAYALKKLDQGLSWEYAWGVFTVKVAQVTDKRLNAAIRTANDFIALKQFSNEKQIRAWIARICLPKEGRG